MIDNLNKKRSDFNTHFVFYFHKTFHNIDRLFIRRKIINVPITQVVAVAY